MAALARPVFLQGPLARDGRALRADVEAAHLRDHGHHCGSPTCSLPEELGGQRNWDYRYTWIRDAAFTLYALLRIGFTDEASRFMGWIEDCTQDLNPDGSMQIMYGIDGRHDLKEETLDHLEGYKGSRPVRIGNGAYGNFEWISTVNSSTQYTSTINTAPRSPTTSGPYSKTGQLGL